MKLVTLEETLDRYIGIHSTEKRKKFEQDLLLDLSDNNSGDWCIEEN
jgi:hypothetical protein